MSIETWKSEFYPIPADECPKEEAVAHSLRKWTGSRLENLYKHNLRQRVCLIIDDINYEEFSFAAETCALCKKFYDNEPEINDYLHRCSRCPLFQVRGNVACDEERRDEEESPWGKGIHDPEPMIMWLTLALLYMQGDIDMVENVPDGSV